VRIQRFLGRGDERGMIGEAEIIVGAEIQNALTAGDGDVCILGRSNNALGLVETLCFDFIERFCELLIKFCEHPAILPEPSPVQRCEPHRRMTEPFRAMV